MHSLKCICVATYKFASKQAVVHKTQPHMGRGDSFRRCRRGDKQPHPLCAQRHGTAAADGVRRGQRLARGPARVHGTRPWTLCPGTTPAIPHPSSIIALAAPCCWGVCASRRKVRCRDAPECWSSQPAVVALCCLPTQRRTVDCYIACCPCCPVKRSSTHTGLHLRWHVLTPLSTPAAAPADSMPQMLVALVAQHTSLHLFSLQHYGTSGIPLPSSCTSHSNKRHLWRSLQEAPRALRREDQCPCIAANRTMGCSRRTRVLLGGKPLFLVSRSSPYQ